MKFICLMGRSQSGKSSVENKLEQLGFKRSISYTTREPQIRKGKLEENGKDYIFVSREEFLNLVEKGYIIEYEEYNNNLYGTPRPFGSTRYVAVVCIGGFKALKKLYGNQVIGVHLKIDAKTAEERGKARDGSTELTINRKDEDDKLTKQMEDEADIVIDSSKDLNIIVADILKYVKGLEESSNENV